VYSMGVHFLFSVDFEGSNLAFSCLENFTPSSSMTLICVSKIEIYFDYIDERSIQFKLPIIRLKIAFCKGGGRTETGLCTIPG